MTVQEAIEILQTFEKEMVLMHQVPLGMGGEELMEVDYIEQEEDYIELI